MRGLMEDTIEHKVPVDLISVIRIWLAGFAEKGLLSDLTNYTKKWGQAF